MENLTLAIHTALCVLLGWSAWCRLVKMHANSTYPSIRLAFTFSAMVATALVIAPWGWKLWPDWFPYYEPHPLFIAMLIAFLAVQVSTSHHWRHGVPRSFVKES